MAHRYVCVHGHFYQPPRQNPFTGLIPPEAGAEPFANYNEKINAECYRPNGLYGNYRRISFDVGPTLTDWLAGHDPATLRRMVEADRWAIRHHGAGPAMAQSYHHTILPLDTPRDRRTEVRWGIRDFQYWCCPVAGRLPSSSTTPASPAWSPSTRT
jgi:alpha-amylase/alpha-mannosidase (GH57 family)